MEFDCAGLSRAAFNGRALELCETIKLFNYLLQFSSFVSWPFSRVAGLVR